MRSATVQGKATAAAHWRMWALAKRKRPFLDAKLVKERTLETLEELFAGGKNKADIVTRVIPRQCKEWLMFVIYVD